MKKLMVLGLMLVSTQTFAYELHNFDEVKNVVSTGKQIHMVMEFSKCTRVTTSVQPAPEVMSRAIFTPNEISIMNGHIATSLFHFTINNPKAPGIPVYEFVRYTLTEDNNVNVAAEVFKAVDYTSIDTISANCKLGETMKIYT